MLLRRCCCLLTLAGALAGCYYSVRLGLADWLAQEGTVAATSKSLKLAPGNSEYLGNAAAAMDDSGLDGTPLWERAALVNSLDARNWIRLSGRAEGNGDEATAEADLHRAYRADPEFDSRWALANFYLRRGDRLHTLEWARRTLEFGSGDLKAVFQLCWEAGAAGSEILEKAIPARSTVLGAYLGYLNNAAGSEATAKIEAATAVTKKLLGVAGKEEERALVDFCSRALSQGQVEDAYTVWNGLIARGLLQAELVVPSAGGLVNADFAREPTGAGFDWTVQTVDGITVQRPGSGIRVVFSGKEPESFVLLGQFVALVPSRNYRFSFRYECGDMTGAGLKWVFFDPRTEAVVASAGPNDDTAGEHGAEARFEAPADVDLVRLELRYAREPGTVRPDGWIRFSRLRLEAEP